MAKLKKVLSGMEKEKSKTVSGKITKFKKSTEKSQMGKVQQSLDSPAQAQQKKLENSISATPFSAKCTLAFTSTPMNIESTLPNVSGKLSLRKLPPRLALSPIFDNVCNTKQERKETVDKVKVSKENPPKNNMIDGKLNIENSDPHIRIGTRRKSIGVRRMAPIAEKTGTLVNKENMESQSSSLRVRLRKLDTSVESPGSYLQSSKRNNRNTLQMHANDSSVSLDCSNVHGRAKDKLLPNSGNNNTIVRRLQSDWSSTTLGEEISTSPLAQKSRMTSKSPKNSVGKQQYKQNNCSELRVRLSKNALNSNPSNSKQKSYMDNSLVNRLKSDWTNTTIEDMPAKNRTPKENRIQKKQVNKRRLTPLIEMSVENMTNPTNTPTATPKKVTRVQNDNDEKEYSSSAEFQSDDEGNHQSRSKQAPTWKDLLNKTNESPVLGQNQPEIKLKRSRRLEFKTGTDPALNPEKEIQNSKQKEKEKPTDISDSFKVVESVIEVEKAPDTDKSEELTKKKKEDVLKVSNDVPFKEIHALGNQNQDSAEYVSVCEETIGTTSPPQHNYLPKPDSGKKANLSSRGGETSTNETNNIRCPVKFFNSRLENTVFEKKPSENLKRRRSGRRKKQESIYEFLSQSSSESNNQLDDVIQKMIKTGKVVVAKHKKGTGKSIVPRKKNNKNQRKKTTKSEEIPLKPTKLLASKPPIGEKIQNNYNDNLHFDDDFHFDDGGDNIQDEKEQPRDQRGFSNLARSAMIKQAGRIQKPLKRKPITDKKKLLEMAMKFVSQSTPVRMTPQRINAPQLSPMAGNKSPWRVDDDKLPNLFYLGRDSNNLPSFSSDYIPMTPSKNKSRSISSFSSNDSNGENKAPPGAEIPSNDVNMQTLTNTRKALNYRSPLKAINIIEVVNLPPLALHSYGKQCNDENTSKNNLNKSTRTSTSTHKSTQSVSNNNSFNNSNNYLNNNSNHSKSDVSNENAENQFEFTPNQNLLESNNVITNNNNLTNLFGFEELIDDENNSSNTSVDKTILPNKEVLKEKLQRLRQLLPNKPVIIPNKTNRIKPIFDNVRPQQKTIKQMLCSTMIDDNQHHRDAVKNNFNEIEDLSNLFKDPETTFDDSNPRRTYSRPLRRKRKRVSNFAIIMDSDASEDEEEAVVKTPIKKYKAKPKKHQKEDQELKNFVNEFNEMCKEVSQYELIVE